MRRWRGPESADMLAINIPQLAGDLPMNALSAAQVRTALLGARPAAPQNDAERTHDRYIGLRALVSARLVEEIAYDTEPESQAVRERIAELVNQLGRAANWPATIDEAVAVIERMYDDLLGFGPVDRLLADTTISEIMVNGPDEIWIERHGRLELSTERFDDTDQLMQVIDRIVSRIGRRVDETSPMVDARLVDGSRVNVVIPPVALTGPTLTIRRFADTGLEVEDIISNGTATPDMVDFLRACVRARLSVLISGGTGSGKTTTLNVLSGFIPEDERIVTIEDAAELKLRQRHVVSTETRSANVEGRGQITIRDLVINSLRMRPDRIVVGECRGGEALDMLQAMNTGHDGSLTTLHANSPAEAVSRLETMVLMAGTDLPTPAIRGQIGAAIQIVVQQARLRDGSRRIVSIAEVCGIEDGEVQLHTLFSFQQRGVEEDGTVIGEHVAHGTFPRRLAEIRNSGQHLDTAMFAIPRSLRSVEGTPQRRATDRRRVMHTSARARKLSAQLLKTGTDS